MNGKWSKFLIGVAVSACTLLTGLAPLSAATPAGELKTVAPMWGNQIPIPYLEITQANDWMHLLYDYLVAQDANGKLSLELGVAEKWEMSPDGLTWTFYLRKGVKFHNGAELTAKDVKFSLDMITLPDSASTQAAFFRRNIDNVEVKDPYTVVIHCKKPSILLPDILSNESGLDGMIIPKDYYEKVGKDEFMKHPIGSGPYKWHSQMAGSFVKLEAAGKHWRDGVPRFKYMTYLVIPEESTRLAMLKTGEADIARISRDAVADAKASGLKIISKKGAAIVHLFPGMQYATPAFGDIRFRKALNLAIDRNAIIKHLFAGLAEPIAMYPGSNAFVIGGDRGFKPYPYDPVEAARLIKEGGWEGYEFTLISFPRAGCPEFPQLVEALSGYWQKIGLKPKIQNTEYATYRKTWQGRKNQNMIYGFDDAVSASLSSLLPKFMDRWYAKNPRANVDVPELNARFEKISKSLSVAEVSKLMGEVYEWAYKNYSTIPICETPDEIATTAKVPNWDPGRRRNDRNYIDLIKQ